jgi:hypothetical protein
MLMFNAVYAAYPAFNNKSEHKFVFDHKGGY